MIIDSSGEVRSTSWRAREGRTVEVFETHYLTTHKQLADGLAGVWPNNSQSQMGRVRQLGD